MSLALGLLLWNLTKTKTKGEVSKRREIARLETSMCETEKQITRSHGGREQVELGKMSRSRVKEVIKKKDIVILQRSPFRGPEPWWLNTKPWTHIIGDKIPTSPFMTV